MSPLIAVLDTNIVASATYWRGKPARCLDAWLLGKFDLAVSQPILSEYEEVIRRLAVRYPAKHPVDWLTAIKHGARMFYPVSLPSQTVDPDDEMFIECAVAAGADYLVTGDKAHLLSLKQVSGISIVTASDFLSLL